MAYVSCCTLAMSSDACYMVSMDIHRPQTEQWDWKVFHNKRPRAQNGLYVSLNERGVLLLSRKVYAEMKSPLAVRLQYDERRSVIGVEPDELFYPTSVPVHPRGKSGNHIVWALPFLEENNIRPGSTIKFLDPHFENGILILDLKLIARATQKPRTGWRKRKPTR